VCVCVICACVHVCVCACVCVSTSFLINVFIFSRHKNSCCNYLRDQGLNKPIYMVVNILLYCHCSSCHGPVLLCRTRWLSGRAFASGAVGHGFECTVYQNKHVVMYTVIFGVCVCMCIYVYIVIIVSLCCIYKICMYICVQVIMMSQIYFKS
jgi:hypothetical protein